MFVTHTFVLFLAACAPASPKPDCHVARLEGFATIESCTAAARASLNGIAWAAGRRRGDTLPPGFDARAECRPGPETRKS